MKDSGRILLRALPWAALLALATWARWPGPIWLVVAAGTVTAALIAGRYGPVRRIVGLLVVLVGVLVGFGVQQRDVHLTRSWDAYWSDREAVVVEDLDRRLGQLLDRTIANVGTLADEAASGNLPDLSRMAVLRGGAGLSALALYDGDGVLRIWDGMHRGQVPQAVKLGEQPYVFGEAPLFSYLYVTRPVAGGGTAVGALLLRTDLPGQTGDDQDFSSRFHARTGETLQLSTPDRARAAGVFDYMHEDNALFSLSVQRPSQAARRAELRARGQFWVTAAVLAAWFLLGLAADPSALRGTPALIVGFMLALILPVHVVPGLAALSGPGDVLLFPAGTLARLIVTLAFLVVAAGGARPWLWPRVPMAVAGGAVAVGFPLVARGFGTSASVGFLAGTEGGWVAYQVALTGAFVLLAWGAIALGRGEGRTRHRPALALGIAAALAAILAWLVVHEASAPVWFLSLWGLPLVIALGIGPRSEEKGRLVAWTVAVGLGASAAIPIAWGQRLEARLTSVESQVDRLGTGVDPYLQFLLERLAEAVDTLDAGGAPPAELLYRGWRNSGLAEAGYPVWMTLWRPGGELMDEELRIGMGGVDRPVVANRFLGSASASDTVTVHRFDSFQAHYMVQVPLAAGRTVTAVVPPLGTTGAESLLGPLFGSLGPSQPESLRLIPLSPSETDTPLRELRWTRRAGVWRGEVAVDMAGSLYQARYEVPVAGAGVLSARGSLLLVFDLIVLTLAWWIGTRLSGGTRQRSSARFQGLTSFRGRVTLALFSFFVLSNLIFGSLAYRTIAGASQRAARVLAERAAGEAAGSYLDVGGDVDLLASRVGIDVLEYKDGELRDGSVEELVSLGLYEGWVPYAVHRSLVSRDVLSQTASTALGRWEYVTAYRRLPDGDIIGAPVPLQAGATAIQSRDVAELLTAAVLAGGALSFLLALLVGRALTRPIETLRIASERVGGGNLGVRLPDERHDEFGAVFVAFNRMVRRLRGARRDLVRTSRRTQAIVDDAATGVLAFDAEGTVTLANPTARSLLEMTISIGEPLSSGEEPAREFVRWVDTYFRDGLGEASLELQLGERRVRVRARRISHAGPLAGAVMSLEDVTDELRTERILAWGEMARQVAHEVKNPLTPIKLSVQHLRRAWEDGRADFGDILTRNADAMLREIDRLAAIATSFSRFGAPRAAGEEPLSKVQIGSVVREVLALYGGGEGSVRFSAVLDPDLPLVLARDSEVKEVLVNLLENSRAAVRAGGEVRVEGHHEDGVVVLRVVDDGIGIPEAFLGRIFEPHFSTRSAGTGLGLAIVHRLVTSWGGEIQVESREGAGTVVALRLLAVDARGSGPGASDTTVLE